MPKRNEAFTSRHPFKHHPALQLNPNRVNGPVSFLNPTSAHFKPTGAPSTRTDISPDNADEDKTHADSPDSNAEQPASNVSYKWTSRNNRKGRHALAINPESSLEKAKYTTPPLTSSLKEIALGIWRMLTYYPVWDVSYDVAAIFTWGSVIWVINAFFVWFPLVRPDTEFKNEILYGGGITAFIGATVFEVGSILLMAEAVNENRTGCFGWALERALSHDTEKDQGTITLRPSKTTCTHHHRNRKNLVGKGRATAAETQSGPKSGSDYGSGKSWIWFPTMADLRDHYIHELGFLASLSQLIGASIFWVAGLTSLPGIYDKMSRPITIVFYWTPQVVGGLGFIISGTLFMVETQPKWYVPAFKTLGWWIGAWNLIGGIGFTICPAFGYDTESWAQYQASLSTFWGSWAFLIGSVIQWYESLDKHPVEADKSLRMEDSNV